VVEELDEVLLVLRLGLEELVENLVEDLVEELVEELVEVPLELGKRNVAPSYD
jgi:hypothetical protein